MKHEDWLYLIEFFLRRGRSAEDVVKAMKKSEAPDIFDRLREKLNSKGVISEYL